MASVIVYFVRNKHKDFPEISALVKDPMGYSQVEMEAYAVECAARMCYDIGGKKNVKVAWRSANEIYLTQQIQNRDMIFSPLLRVHIVPATK